MTPIELLQLEIDFLDTADSGVLHPWIVKYRAALELAIADARYEEFHRRTTEWNTNNRDNDFALLESLRNARTHLYSLLTKGE